jgi:hypothetical protein
MRPGEKRRASPGLSLQFAKLGKIAARTRELPLIDPGIAADIGAFMQNSVRGGFSTCSRLYHRTVKGMMDQFTSRH